VHALWWGARSVAAREGARTPLNPSKPRPKKAQIRWKPEHYAFVEAMYPTRTVTQLSGDFKEKFGLTISPSAIGWKIWFHQIKKKPRAKDTAKA